MRRSPRQTVLTVALLLTGIWIGVRIVQSEGERQAAQAQPPDLELRDLSPAELAAHPRFGLHEHAPKTWERISLRLYAQRDGSYQRFLRCRIDAAEVVPANRHLFAHPGRRRSVDDLPPAWWPRAEEGPWRIPAWWRPAGVHSAALSERLKDGQWLGEYVDYDPASGWFHLWEWRRPIAGPSAVPGVEALSGALTLVLLAEGQAAGEDGWLHAPGLAPARLGEAAPAGLRRVDALLLPRAQGMRSLLALHGLDEDQARALLDDQPVRTLPADGAAPSSWDFALRDGALPSWFSPGPGPRWGYSLVRPGEGRVDAGRWAAYDRSRAILFVWDWAGDEPRPPSADLFPPPAGDAAAGTALAPAPAD